MSRSSAPLRFAQNDKLMSSQAEGLDMTKRGVRDPKFVFLLEDRYAITLLVAESLQDPLN